MSLTSDIFEYVNQLGGHSVNANDLDIQMLILNNDLELYRANTSQSMKNDLIASFFTPIANLLTYGPDRGLSILDYDSVMKPDHEVIWKLSASDVPNFQSVSTPLSLPIDEIPVYADDQGDMEGVTALGLYVQSKYGDMIIFQRIIPNYILKKSRKFSMLFSGTSFDELKAPAAFQVGKDNHVVYFSNYLYVLNQNHFEYIFDYQEKKASIAEDKLIKIEADYVDNLLIENGKSLFELLAGDKRAINKLQALDSTLDLNEQNLTKIKLEYDVDIKIDASTGKMQINSKKDVKELINILNDDYLLSDMTSGKYTVHSKKKIVPKE